MKISSLLIVALGAFSLATSHGQIIIIGDNADATPEDRNTLGPPAVPDVSDGLGDSVQDLSKGDGTVRAGSFATAYPSRRAAVFVFQLPTLAVGETLSTADFSVRLFSRQNTPAYNVDLWALRVSSSNSTVLASDYGAGSTPSGPVGQALLQSDFATTTSSTTTRLSTDSTADTALTNFLNTNWQNGGFVFIRANVDADPLTFSANGAGTLAQGYDFGAANRPDDIERPQLAITVIPEPSSAALLIAAGACAFLLRRRKA